MLISRVALSQGIDDKFMQVVLVAASPIKRGELTVDDLGIWRGLPVATAGDEAVQIARS